MEWRKIVFSMGNTTAINFLQDIRVIDFSQFLPGPYATQLLSDLGAEVIKVERSGGDAMRKVGPIGNDGISLFYKTLNSGKQIIELDLQSESGKNYFTELLNCADVLLESFRPGVLDKLGFSVERLRRDYPRLVICSLSGYGQTGPYRLRPGHDLNYLAHSGLLHHTGSVDSPTQPQPPISDYAGAMQAVNCILAALFGRTVSNQGAYLDISLAETVLSWQGMALNNSGRQAYSTERGNGVDSGGAAGYRIYRTADKRFITLGIEGEPFWSKFCNTVDKPEWIGRLVEPIPQTALIDEVQALFLSQTNAFWCELLDEADCCFEAVLDIDDIMQHPQVRARQLLTTSNGTDPFVQVNYPAWINGAPPTNRPPPHDTSIDSILKTWEFDT